MLLYSVNGLANNGIYLTILRAKVVVRRGDAVLHTQCLKMYSFFTMVFITNKKNCVGIVTDQHKSLNTILKMTFTTTYICMTFSRLIELL